MKFNSAIFRFCFSYFLLLALTGCVTVFDKNNLSNLSQDEISVYNKIPYSAKNKDVLITFPASTSDQEKKSKLEAEARIKANQKCLYRPYKVQEIESRPWDGSNISYIAANIFCIPAQVAPENPPAKPLENLQISEPTVRKIELQESPTVKKTEDITRGYLSIDAAKKKCTELGFKPATEGYGKCVLQLSK
jgi:hypothetical protein